VPDPIPTQPPSLLPSASTTAGLTIGAAVGVVAVWAIEAFTTVQVPSYVAMAIGVICSQGGGYFFPGGRKQS
jgi:hypothetical protein